MGRTSVRRSSMVRLFILLSVAVITIFPQSAWPCLGCGQTYNFCTRAEYEAPKMRYVIKTLGAGTVKAGQDFSYEFKGAAMVCPAANSSAKPIRLRRNGAQSARYEIVGGESGFLIWTFRDKPSVLQRVFRSAGFGNISPEEIAETMRVWGNVSSGPKGTTMPGQSKFLKVNSVEFQRQICDRKTPNKWIEQISLTLGCSS